MKFLVSKEIVVGGRSKVKYENLVLSSELIKVELPNVKDLESFGELALRIFQGGNSTFKFSTRLIKPEFREQ